MSRRSRWAAGALLTFPALYALYLVVMNAILLTGSLESLVNGRQDNVRVTADRAWTWWFGRVHAEGLRIVIQEEDVEVLVSFPRAAATLSVWELPGLVFHAREIRGDGGVLSIRRRVPVAEATPERLAGLPDIPGLPPPIIPVAPGPDTDLSNNWTIHMDDMDAHFDTVWFDNYRLDGAIHVRGGYEWAAAQWVRFDGVALQIEGGRLAIAGQPAGAGIEAEVALSSEALTQTPPAPLRELLERTRAIAFVRAELAEPSALQWFVPADVPLSFEGGTAVLELAGALLDGSFSPGTRAAIELDQWAVGYERAHATTSGTVALEADPTATTAALDLDAALRWAADGDAEPLATIAPARARLRWRDRSAMTLATVPASDVLIEADTPRLGSVAEVLGADPGFIAGAAHWRLDSLLGPDGTGRSEIAVRTKRVSMSWAHLAYHCEIATSATLSHQAPLRAEGGGKLVIAKLSTKNGDDDWEGSSWTAQLDLHRLAFDLESEPSFTIAARGFADHASPILDLPPLDDAVPDVPLALIDLEDLKVDVGFFSLGDRFEIKVYDASTDGLSLRGRMLGQNGHKTGRFLVDAPLVTLGLDVATGGVTVVTNPERDWGARHLAELVR